MYAPQSAVIWVNAAQWCLPMSSTRLWVDYEERHSWFEVMWPPYNNTKWGFEGGIEKGRPPHLILALWSINIDWHNYELGKIREEWGVNVSRQTEWVDLSPPTTRLLRLWLEKCLCFSQQAPSLILSRKIQIKRTGKHAKTWVLHINYWINEKPKRNFSKLDHSKTK